MSDNVMDSAKDDSIGVAIAEYLAAIDSQRPLDINDWLTKHNHVRESLQEFLANQSQLNRLATLETPAGSAPHSPLAGSTSVAIPVPDSSRSAHHEPSVAKPGQIEIGDELGPYQLVSLLGHGGMGRVYAARHQSLGRTVALKVLVDGDRADESDRRRFRREAEAVAKLDHPNIVPIFEVGQQRGWDYFTMKLLQAGSLSNWMSHSSTVSLRQIAEAMVEIALGLQHAHQRGILHRDLKPSNILLDELQRPCLVDFGLAKQLSHEHTTHGQVLGTPAYMAPEQLYGETTTLSDVYALGATLYSLIAKRSPFAGKNLLELSDQIRLQSPPPLSKFRRDIPRDLEVICLKCLEKSQDQRYASAADFAADLRRWLHGEPIQGRPVPWQVQAWKWCRRHPMVSGLAATLLTVVLGSTVVLSLLLNETYRLGQAATASAQQATDNLVVAEGNARKASISAKEAIQQRDRARQLLEVMTSTVAYEWLAGQESLTASQQLFLRQNVDYYRELLAEGAEAIDDEQLWWLAQVQHRLASLIGRLGDREEALSLVGQANETLSKVSPQWPPLQLLLTRSQVLHDQQTWLADNGQLQPSIAVLHKAVDVLNEALKLDPNNLEASQRLGQLKVDLGTRFRFSGKAGEALPVLEDAVEWNTELLTRQPQSPGIRRQLAISLRNLGLVQMQLRDYESAAGSMSRALEVQRELAEQSPEQWRLKADVANTLDNLGLVFDRQGDLTRAAETISQAMEHHRQLLRVLPGEETVHRALTQSFLNLAAISKSQADWDKDREILQATITHVQNAQDRYPTILEYQYWEWVAKLGMVENYSHAGEQQQALELLNEVIPKLETATPDAMGSKILRNQLLRAWNGRAPILSSLGEHQAAMADWQSCVNKTSGIEQTNHRLCKAIACAKADLADEALSIVADAMQDTNTFAGHRLLANLHYNVACVKSVLATKTDDPTRREELLSEGTEAIKQAFECGWTAIDWLREDVDLAALQEYAPFQELLNLASLR